MRARNNINSVYRTAVLLIAVLCASISARAEVPIQAPDLSENTGIAPAFFGPNAFPVPDMLDGRTQQQLRLEVVGDGYWGYQGDRTADVFARLFIPLYTDRVNLTIWMPVMEWYQMTEERQRYCRLQDTAIIRGHGAGDVYISTDIQLTRGYRYCPDMALRVGMKTASGGQFELARYYDNPAYFFDLAVGKSLYLGKGRTFPFAEAEDAPVELRFYGSAGFLCWQTDNGRQNDAVMYGLGMLLKTRYVSVSQTWTGYVGWEKNGDQPMVLRTRLAGHIGDFEPFALYQYGVKDYPFHQLRVGLAYHIDLFKHRKP